MTADQEALLLLNDNEASVCAAVARAMDEHCWLPDEIVVWVLRATETLGPYLSRRLGFEVDERGLAVGCVRLAEAEALLDSLGLPRNALARSPTAGRVRALCTVCSTLVLAHSLYVLPHNKQQWQDRLDRLVDRALAGLARPAPGKGPPS